MKARLPSLNALRAFEAAARLGSVSQAATELSVTPGAVSHQIKLLEADLDVSLLKRVGRNVAPTPEARAGLAALGQAFEHMAASVRAIREATRRPALVVSVPPSFASSWLVPRLDRYWAEAPDVDVRIETKWGLTDFTRDGVDLAIRFGPGGYAGMFEKRLIAESYFPVCSPDLLKKKRLVEPADLADHVLLHLHIDADYLGPDFPNWRMWLIAAGVEDQVDYRRGPQFHISELALKAARDGHGVALGSTALVADDIKRGHLVRPFPQSVVAHHAYHVVCPPSHLERPVVAAFINWVMREAAAFSEVEGDKLQQGSQS